MDLSGERIISLPRAQVWHALNDLSVLKESIPGCETLTETAPNQLEAVATAKIGPVKATFKGHVELTNIVPNTSYSISGQGKGGAAGFAKGRADITLSDHEQGTLLSYVVSANLGGKLAQLGARIIDQAAKKMADEFFDNFTKCLSKPTVELQAPPSTDADEGGIPARHWIGGLIVILALSIIVFTQLL